MTIKHDILSICNFALDQTYKSVTFYFKNRNSTVSL